MRKLLTGLILLVSISSFGAEKLLLDNFRGTRFELNQFSISIDNYTGTCDREAIQDNTFANGSRVFRSEIGLQEGAKAYLFDDPERCHQLNFSIIIVERVDFFKNELKIGLYNANWSKGYGNKPIIINDLYGAIQVDAKCSILKEGIIFQDTYVNCDLLDNTGKKIGTMKFVEI